MDDMALRAGTGERRTTNAPSVERLFTRMTRISSGDTTNISVWTAGKE